MTQLLVEILCGEIPARMQKQGAAAFKDLMLQGLEKQGLSFGKADVFYTSRRLALVIENISLKSEDREEEKKGPRVDAPETAIAGFLRSVGLSREACEVKTLNQVDFLFAHKVIKGQDTAVLLPEIIQEALFGIPWPKSMRWGKGTVSWVRPIQSGICLFAGKPVIFDVRFGEDDQAPKVVFGDETQGHRFMRTKALRVQDFEDYQKKLKQAFVILDPEERKEKIQQEISALLKNKSLKLKEDSGLLEEVTGLVEWPVAFLGQINEAFMKLPPEVLITSMRVHQRYFSLQDENGQLAPFFICIGNIQPIDKGETLVKGNQRVLTARLADAQFFYDSDRQIPLETHGAKLNKITFHTQLGTLKEKTIRLGTLSQWIAKELNLDSDAAKKAALLSKADLGTKMVYEFPELQGIMGYYYAKPHHSVSIAQAIQEHYQPRDARDALPESDLGNVLALADRLDTLVGFFAINIKPTGSKDPFALRRAALGMIRILEQGHDLSLGSLFTEAYKLYTFSSKDTMSQEELIESLRAFFLDRLKVYWRENGWRHDYITAVFALAEEDPLWVLRKRIEALNNFLTTESGVNLLAGYRRATNIVKMEEKKDQILYTGVVDPGFFKEEIEKQLYQSLKKSEEEIQNALVKKDFTYVMKVLSDLRPLIDQYFTEVRVNSDQPAERVNRLQTLAMIRHTLQQVADFSKIED